MGTDGLAVPEENIQPGSIDLRLGDIAYATQFSFLPGQQDRGPEAGRFKVEEIDLRRGCRPRDQAAVPGAARRDAGPPSFVAGQGQPQKLYWPARRFHAGHHRSQLPV